MLQHHRCMLPASTGDDRNYPRCVQTFRPAIETSRLATDMSNNVHNLWTRWIAFNFNQAFYPKKIPSKSCLHRGNCCSQRLRCNRHICRETVGRRRVAMIVHVVMVMVAVIMVIVM